MVDCRAAGQPQLVLQISYEAVASLQHTQSVCAVRMCFYTIIAIKAYRRTIDTMRWTVVLRIAAGQPQLDLSDQLISYEKGGNQQQITKSILLPSLIACYVGVRL